MLESWHWRCPVTKARARGVPQFQPLPRPHSQAPKHQLLVLKVPSGTSLGGPVGCLESPHLGLPWAPPVTALRPDCCLKTLAERITRRNVCVCMYACTHSQSSLTLLLHDCSPLAHQAPLSMEFSRQKYWSGLSFPPPGDLPDPGIEPASPALAGRFFTH